MRSGPGIGPHSGWRRRLLWTIWVNAAGIALPTDSKSEPAAHSRREFLKKAAGVAVGLPAAGALAGTAAAAPRISLTSRAKPFEGVTLQFAKAPFGTDEKDVIAKLLKPFEDKTGAKVEHTIVPWNVEGATYATNYAGPNPFDVSYQTSTDLTGLGTKGVLEVLNTSKWLNSPVLRLDEGEVHPQHDHEEHLPGQALRPAVHHRRHRHLLQQGPAREGRRRQHPADRDRALAAAAKVQKLGGGVWGHNVPLSNKDFTWYFLYHGIHNRGTDIISKDQSKVTFNNAQAGGGAAVLRRPVIKQGAAAGRAVRPRGRRLAVQGRPDRLPPRRAAPPSRPSGRRSSRSSGTSSTRWAPQGSARSSRPPATG